MCVGLKSCLTLCYPMDYIAQQAPLSMEFSRQEYWNGLPLPFLEDLPDPGIEPRSPALQADSLPYEPPGKQKDRAQSRSRTVVETEVSSLKGDMSPPPEAKVSTLPSKDDFLQGNPKLPTYPPSSDFHCLATRQIGLKC